MFRVGVGGWGGGGSYPHWIKPCYVFHGGSFLMSQSVPIKCYEMSKMSKTSCLLLHPSYIMMFILEQLSQATVCMTYNCSHLQLE